MKCIFGATQNGHAPARYMRFGRIGEFPESPERVTRLLEGVGRAGLDVMAPRTFPLQHLAAVHSARYLDFLEHGHGQWMEMPDAFPEMMPSVPHSVTPVATMSTVQAPGERNDAARPVVA